MKEPLLTFLHENIKSEKLKCRIVEARPPSPGFWPARIDDTHAALVINASDLEYLATEPALLKASFLRALATLYYLEESRFPPVYFRGRNVLYEFSAFMTGNHVESIYLNEIVPINSNVPIAKDWHNWLLDSAKNNNLAGIAQDLYGIFINYAYYYLSILQNLSSYQQIVEMLRSMNNVPPALLENIKLGLFAGFALTPQYIADGVTARTILITDPWILLVINLLIPQNNTEIQKMVQNTYKTMDSVHKYYKHLEPIILERRQKLLDSYVFWAPEESILGYTNSAKLEKTTAAALSIPGSVKTSWYRECDSFSGNQYRGYIPLTEKEALTTAAYRFSYGTDETLLGVEYFIKGQLQMSGVLQDAARIIVIREGGTEMWRWEDVSGRLITNDSGFALMIIEALRGAERDPVTELSPLTFTFYDRDGRRVFHYSGAWSIRRTKVSRGFEDSFYDDRGLLIENNDGFAKIRYSVMASDSLENKNPNMRYEIRYFDRDGNPAFSQLLGVHGIVEQHTENSSLYTVETSYIDEKNQPTKTFDYGWIQRRKIGKDQLVYEFLDRERKPVISLFGYSSIKSVIKNGLVVMDAFFDTAGKPVNNLAGFHKRKIEYTDRGYIADLSYFDTRNKAVLGMDGYHRQVSKYDKNGFLEELFFYDTEGKLMNDYSGAAHIRWYRDELGHVYAVDAWDAAGSRLSGGAGKDI